MKKILTVLSVATFFATVSKAQSDASGLEYGIKVGVNFCSDKANDGSPSGTGFHGGIYAAFPVSVIKIQPELFYDNQNFKQSIMGYSVTLNANYLSFPVLAKYRFKNTGFSVLAGPQIGYLLSAKAKLSGGGMSETTNVDNSFKKTNFSIALGAEYDLPFGLNFSARYNIGLSNLDKNTSNGSSDKFNSFAIAVGYKFGKE